MGIFFGTDGLRGKVNEVLTFDVAYKIGNALSILKENPTVLTSSVLVSRARKFRTRKCTEFLFITCYFAFEEF